MKESLKYYTEKEHAQNLLSFLEGNNTCKHCIRECSNYKKKDPVPLGILCGMCKSFIGLAPIEACPCIVFGKFEARKRTWILLEEKRYI